MWNLQVPKPAKLIIGILAADEECLKAAIEAINADFGKTDFVSDIWPFDQTDYYKDQTGENILRQFVSIEKLINPGKLAKIKPKLKRRKLMNNATLNRRTFIRNTSLIAAGAVAGSLARTGQAVSAANVERIVKNDRINQSVSKWCYGKFSLDELCAISKKMGIKAIDLLGPDDFPTLKKHGLVCSMVSTHSLTKGLNRKENHEQCLAQIRSAIDATAEYEFPNVITFPGNRAGMPDDVGIDNTVVALKQIAGYAEKKKVTICIEYLNSKVNHKDYMFDKTAWGVEVCKRVACENVKILYDIYHAQIMEGDIIRTIQDYHEYFGHYHTGGNPGRNEIDETQELYYPAIMRAIADTGFKGYVAHEFVPKRDPIESLAYAVRICDV